MDNAHDELVAVAAHAMLGDLAVILASAEMLAEGNADTERVLAILTKRARALGDRLDVLVRTGDLALAG